MNKGFYFKRLLLTGPGKKTASIEFTKGLNVVAGASNTGKTFIFQCLDFMLGGKKTPKPIPESQGYNQVILEIVSYEGNTYTLQRNIAGGPFRIKQGDLQSSIPFETYREALNVDPRNISTFLLSLCGLETVQLRKNSRNEKVRLSFRDVAGLCLVDEKRIISEESPAYQSGEAVGRTKEQSLFYYFILGKDATELVETEDPKILKNKIAGKVELIKELMERTQSKLEEFEGQNVEGLEKELEALYESLNLEYRTSLVQIDKLRNQKADLFKNIAKAETKVIHNKELIQRFELLEKHYISDKRRLEFISEGSFLLDQLKNVACPICGSAINDAHEEHLALFQNENVGYENSVAKEIEKITLKQTELGQTISTLKEEVTKQNRNIEKIQEKITTIDELLNTSLAPITASLKERLKVVSSSKTALERYKTLKSDMQAYTDQLSALSKQGNAKIQDNEETFQQHNQLFSEFCAAVEHVLNNWKFPSITSLTFDKRYAAFDIRINNDPRSTNGKGYRAITFTAFLFGLMLYCKAKERNHPSFVIFDSPLTTFKDQDVSSEDDKVDTSVEFGFFEALSNSQSGKQVIVFENKEPDISLHGNMNYIHFSGQEGLGRKGFF